MTHDPYTLPANLPVPADDGAADHLAGASLPSLRLASTHGLLELAERTCGATVIYVYPRTGRPGVPLPPGWDDIPGARGCTPQSCAFRDHADELQALGARVVGASAQTLEEQEEFAARARIPYPLVADPALELAAALDLPTFEVAGLRLYRRLTLIAEGRTIAKAFYPVFPPDRNASDVVAWLRRRTV